jgi:hypothetical protein
MSNNRLFLFFFLFLVLSCNSYQKPTESHLPENLDEASKMKYTQYLIQGKILYNTYCTKGSKKDSNININMPAQPELSNLEIAEILTYISNSWGNQSGFISVSKVATSLVDCATH